MFEVAGGQLYWPLEQALHTDMNFIQMAYKGHTDMLIAVFGSSKPTTKEVPKGADGKPIVITPNSFDVTFDKPRDRRAKVQNRMD